MTMVIYHYACGVCFSQLGLLIKCVPVFGSSSRVFVGYCGLVFPIVKCTSLDTVVPPILNSKASMRSSLEWIVLRLQRFLILQDLHSLQILVLQFLGI